MTTTTTTTTATSDDDDDNDNNNDNDDDDAGRDRQTVFRLTAEHKHAANQSARQTKDTFTVYCQAYTTNDEY